MITSGEEERTSTRWEVTRGSCLESMEERGWVGMNESCGNQSHACGLIPMSCQPKMSPELFVDKLQKCAPKFQQGWNCVKKT